MKKTDKPQQEQKPLGQVTKQPKGVTELTDQDLQQVQGGSSLGSNPETIKLISETPKKI